MPEEEKVNVATSWDSVLANDFQEPTQTDVLDAPVDTVVETPTDVTQIVIPEVTDVPTDASIETTTVIPETTVVEEIQPLQEKIVEKVVEKYPEMSEDAQTLLKALQDGKFEDVYKHLEYKFKDFKTMSDYDVVKEGLKNDHPEWTDKRIDLEFKTKYDIQEKRSTADLDPVEDATQIEKIEAFNESVDQRRMLLEMQAEEYRIKLENNKTSIEFPKVTENTQQAVNEPTAEQIAEANEQWEQLVTSEVPKLSDFKYKVNGEDVVYKITPEEKAGLTETMKGFNASEYLTKRGWFDQEGVPNILRITEDVYRLENEGKMIGSVATQIKTATRKEVISKDIKNIDHEDKSTANVNVQKPAWQIIMEAGE